MVLRSDARVQGPGGADLVVTGGRGLVAYAGWDTGDIGPPNPRRLHLGELIVTSDEVTIAPL